MNGAPDRATVREILAGVPGVTLGEASIIGQATERLGCTNRDVVSQMLGYLQSHSELLSELSRKERLEEIIEVGKVAIGSTKK
jgi:hypothetical protein